VLRERDVAGLYRWLQGAEASGIKEMQALAQTMWLDREAVEAAVRTEFSNGQVEGGVNKLKLRKRDMYGRGKLDLPAAKRPYSSAVLCPICQGASISLPRHQTLTPCGCFTPCAMRRSDQ
jgi:hypothetical protein